jgi:hypothetical protein
MKMAMQEYCHEVDKRAEQFAQAAEMSERAEYLQAFNLGRTVQRIQGAKSDGWVRVGWILAGLALGTALGRAYPDYLCPALAHKYLSKAGLIVRDVGKSAMGKFCKSPSMRS